LRASVPPFKKTTDIKQPGINEACESFFAGFLVSYIPEKMNNAVAETGIVLEGY